MCWSCESFFDVVAATVFVDRVEVEIIFVVVVFVAAIVVIVVEAENDAGDIVVADLKNVAAENLVVV